MPDVRETYMVRYGGDMEMNLNLFLKPEEAKEELNMKLEAQTEVRRERRLGVELDGGLASNVCDGKAVCNRP
jgi:hypothetical protein